MWDVREWGSEVPEAYVNGFKQMLEADAPLARADPNVKVDPKAKKPDQQAKTGGGPTFGDTELKAGCYRITPARGLLSPENSATLTVE